MRLAWFTEGPKWPALRAGHQERVAVVMVSNIVTVAMRGQIEVDHEVVGVAMLVNHLQMVLNGRKDCRRMG